MPYQAPVGEYQFIFDKAIPLSQVTENECFSEATPDLTDAVLKECGKMCDTVMAPLQRPVTCIQHILKMVLSGHHQVLLKDIQRLLKVAGLVFLQARHTAAWACLLP